MDVLDLVSWVREHNWAIVIGYKEAEYNVFDIDKTDPWRHKWVPDPGRIPARKPSVRKRINKRENLPKVKRLLSVPGYSEDEDETSNSSDGRKRSRTTVGSHQKTIRSFTFSAQGSFAESFYLQPSQCTTHRSGSLKKIQIFICKNHT